MAQDPLEHIADILRNHEVRPGGNATFEEVMNRRKKKRRGFFWWFQRAGVGLILIGIAGGIGYLKNLQNVELANKELTLNVPSKNEPLQVSEPEITPNNFEESTDSKNNPETTKESSNKHPKPVKKGELKSSNNSGLFGLFQKFNSRRKNILGGNTADAKGNRFNSPMSINSAGVKDVLTSDASESDLYKNGGSPMSLSNVYEFGAKQYIAQTYFDFQIQENGDEYVDWNFDLPSVGLRKRKLPWYVEFSAITGSDNQIQFDPEENLSVLGTNYMAQYQMSLLREFKGADMWGLGLNYTQWVGNGEWRKRDAIDVWQFDTTLIAVNVPGLPTQYITQLDSQLQQQYSVSTGRIKYNIDKISLPISFRGYTRLLKTNFRYAAQFSPGITRITQGAYFTPTDFMPIERTQRLSFGAKVGMGPIIPVGNGISIVIEPSLMYESFIHESKGLQGNIFGGLGISMMWRLK